jgi:nitrogen fixation/metabolism regulation signal transduction histidine kinase
VQQSLAESRDTLIVILLVAAVLVIIVAVILATTLSRGIIAPIRELQSLADRVSKGDTSTRVEINTNDEIEDLAKIFDRMRASLEIILKRYRIMRQKQS